LQTRHIGSNTEIRRLRGIITRAGNLVENAQQVFAGVA
jgi:hypothetical protein